MVSKTFGDKSGTLSTGDLDINFDELQTGLDAASTDATTALTQVAALASRVAALEAGGGTSPSLPTILASMSLDDYSLVVDQVCTITAPTWQNGVPDNTVTNEFYDIIVNGNVVQTFAKTGATDTFNALVGWAGLNGVVRYRGTHAAGSLQVDSSVFTVTAVSGGVPVNTTAPSLTPTAIDANRTLTMVPGAWTNTPTSYAVTFTISKTATASINSGATSLTLASQWFQAGGTYTVWFSNGEVKTCTFAMYSTAVTWSGGLSSSATAAFEVVLLTSSGASPTRSVTFTLNDIGSTVRGYESATNGNGTSTVVQTSNTVVVRDSIGVVPIASSAASTFNKFASPNGTGNGLSYGTPGSLATMVAGLQAGDRLALLGGSYVRDPNGSYLTINVAGTAQNPVLIESYPGEQATITWSSFVYSVNHSISFRGSYTRVRKINITGCGWTEAITIAGNNNMLEGCNVYGNKGSGILIGGYYVGSGQTVRGCKSYNNNSTGTPYTWSGGDGAWSDGIITDAYPPNVLIDYCEVYANSDDGIDLWGTNGCTLSRTRSHDNGATEGEGQGIKFSGPNGANVNVIHCLAWNNRHTGGSNGFTNNGGGFTLVSYCTAWNNANKGFSAYTSGGAVNYNIAVSNDGGNFYVPSPATWTGNSTQLGIGTPSFISTDPTHVDFLRPTAGGGFTNIGAYAGLAT